MACHIAVLRINHRNDVCMLTLYDGIDSAAYSEPRVFGVFYSCCKSTHFKYGLFLINFISESAKLMLFYILKPCLPFLMVLVNEIIAESFYP